MSRDQNPNPSRAPLLVILVSFWLALIFFGPYARFHHWPGASLVYDLFSSICHQLPERSFAWMGHPLAVCQRCLGLYLGFWLGLIFLPLLRSFRRLLLQNPRSLLLFLLPLGIDLLSDNTAISRLITGVIGSFPIALFVLAALEQVQERFLAPPASQGEYP